MNLKAKTQMEMRPIAIFQFCTYPGQEKLIFEIQITINSVPSPSLSTP